MEQTPGQAVYSIRIRPSHIDSYGHVNNAKYFEIFEEARWELVESRGLGDAYVRKTGLGPVILEASIQFKRELKARDECEVRTSLAGVQGKIFVLEQVLWKLETDEAAAVARFTGALFDLRARKIVELTPEWLSALGGA